MSGKFEPLINCNEPGCGAMVEPALGRCGLHRNGHGPEAPEITCIGLADTACSERVSAGHKRCPRCHAVHKIRRRRSNKGDS